MDENKGALTISADRTPGYRLLQKEQWSIIEYTLNNRCQYEKLSQVMDYYKTHVNMELNIRATKAMELVCINNIKEIYLLVRIE